MSYSASTTPKAPNVAVSTASTPTSKYSRCIWRMSSGRDKHQVLVATFERFATEVVRTELLALDPGAERAVEDQDAFAHGFEEIVH